MKKKLSGIAEKYQIRLMILFGSTAQGRMHKESDIDIVASTPNLRQLV